MNCQNGSCSLRRTNSSNGLFSAGASTTTANIAGGSQVTNQLMLGTALQKFGNMPFTRLQGMQTFNPQMFSNMRPF